MEINIEDFDLDFLISRIIADIDLSAFIEEVVGLDIQWTVPGFSGFCICPFHGDTEPSLSITQKEDGWVFHCFGCKAGGTIVQFYMRFYGESKLSAVKHICRDFGIKSDISLVSKSIGQINTSIDRKKKTASEHIVAANLCRMLLRREIDDKEVRDWVKRAYTDMNTALIEDDFEMMITVSDQAHSMLNSRRK